MSNILNTLPLRERPAYRIRTGTQYCGLVDLLAVIMGGPQQVEMAYALIAKFDTLSAMTKATDTELQEVAGVGPALAARLVAALELGKRLMLEDLGDQPAIKSPSDAVAILRPEMEHLEREHLIVLILDGRNHLVHKSLLYQGNRGSTHVQACEVYQEAIKRGASCIMIAHNHPSGDPAPSPEDIAMTRQLREAGDLLHIELLDHIIIGAQRYISLRERGLGFE